NVVYSDAVQLRASREARWTAGPSAQSFAHQEREREIGTLLSGVCTIMIHPRHSRQYTPTLLAPLWTHPRAVDRGPLPRAWKGAPWMKTDRMKTDWMKTDRMKKTYRRAGRRRWLLTVGCLAATLPLCLTANTVASASKPAHGPANPTVNA